MVDAQLNLEAWNIDAEDEGARLMHGFKFKMPRISQLRSLRVETEDGVKNEADDGIIKQEEFSDGQGANEDDEDEDDEEDEENEAFSSVSLSNRDGKGDEAGDVILGKMTCL